MRKRKSDRPKNVVCLRCMREIPVANYMMACQSHGAKNTLCLGEVALGSGIVSRLIVASKGSKGARV